MSKVPDSYIRDLIQDVVSLDGPKTEAELLSLSKVNFNHLDKNIQSEQVQLVISDMLTKGMIVKKGQGFAMPKNAKRPTRSS